MNVLEKILEEINEKNKFAGRMMVEKPCNKLDEIANDTAQSFISAYEKCSEIIRSHMDEIPNCKECSRRKWYQKGFEDGKKDNDWIPVEEKLPEESGYYMACIYNEEVDDYDFRKTWFVHVDDYDMDESEWRELYDFERVTAWQPLPEPYKQN